MRKSQDGYIMAAIAFLFLIGLVFAVLFLAIFTKWEMSSDNVSGVVYNTTNDRFLSGATQFSIRASEATYVSEENRSTYCIPPGSPYKELVNKAASDKRFKVQITTEKGFWVKAPWTCIGNVIVTEVK